MKKIFVANQYVAVLLFFIAGSLQATLAQVIYDADASDTRVLSNGTVETASSGSSDALRAGREGGGVNAASVVAFELPDLSAGLINADFSIQMTAGPGGGGYAVDLYALGVRSVAAVLASDFAQGASGNVGDQLIMDSFIPANTSGSGRFALDTAAQTTLTSYLNGLGSSAGDFLFFRVQADSTQNSSRFNFSSVEHAAGNGSLDPAQLTLTAVPEPSSFALILTALCACLLHYRKR